MRKSESIVLTGLLASLLCIISPISIPVAGVPVTFTTLLLPIFIYIIDFKHTLGAVIIYIFLGMIGLPVFSGFMGGVGVILSVTGGFIVGYIPMIIIIAFGKLCFCAEKSISVILTLILANLLLYSFGAAWYCIETGNNHITAISICILPFLPGDAIKIAAITALNKKLNKKPKL